MALLTTTRIVRRWNQTGQKHAGSPDIARTFLVAHSFILWILVMALYFDLARRMSLRGLPRAPRQVSTIFAISVCLAALSFKVKYTHADAPELSPGFEQMFMFMKVVEEASLVDQARTVFLSIGLCLTWIVFQRCKGKSRSDSKTTRLGMCIWFAFQDLLIRISRACRAVTRSTNPLTYYTVSS